MAEQTSPENQKDSPNPASSKEPAEGSRENVNTGTPAGGGITNRPLDEEEQEQHQLPPRGTAKDGSHA